MSGVPLAALRPGLAPDLVALVLFVAFARWFSGTVAPMIQDQSARNGDSPQEWADRGRVLGRRMRTAAKVVPVVGLLVVWILAS